VKQKIKQQVARDELSTVINFINNNSLYKNLLLLKTIQKLFPMFSL